MSWPVSRKLNGQESWENKMVKPIVKDVFFLGQKSEPATKADLQVGRDLQDTLKKDIPELLEMMGE